MQARFENLSKFPAEPAARRLAMVNARLQTQLTAPVSAEVPQVLSELADIEGVPARIDMLRLLSVSLPPRELVWWACLAGHDLAGGGGAPAPLAAAEAWVKDPVDSRREAARVAMDAADPDDDTTFCALCAVMADGRLGTGELAQYEAPPGAAENAALSMNLVALAALGCDMERGADYLLDRGLDIARGGDGRGVERPAPMALAQAQQAAMATAARAEGEGGAA